MLDDLHHAGVQSRQPHHRAIGGHACFALDQHLQRGILDIGHPAQVQHHDMRLMFEDEPVDPFGDCLRIDEEQASLRAQDQQPLEGFVVRMLFRYRAQHIGAALAPDDMDSGIGRLAGQADQGDDDGDDDALERTENQHAETSDHRPAELHRPDLADRLELGGLDQPHRIDDDHGGQGGIGQQSEQGGEKEHGGERCAGGNQRRLLRLSANRSYDRRL